MVNISKRYKNLPLREGVGIILLNEKNKIFVGKRIDNPNDYWQMPQGGIDKGENSYKAALRELEEETGIKNVSLIKEINGFVSYNLPNNLLGIIWKGKYKGQKQKWFIMKFTGKESEINISTNKPEFSDWKWIKPETITDKVVDFKLDVYKKLKAEIQKVISN